MHNSIKICEHPDKMCRREGTGDEIRVGAAVEERLTALKQADDTLSSPLKQPESEYAA